MAETTKTNYKKTLNLPATGFPMRAALAKRPRRDITVPEPIVFARIDRESGLLADATSKETVFQSFLEGTVPKRTASAERTTTEGRRLLRMDSF